MEIPFTSQPYQSPAPESTPAGRRFALDLFLISKNSRRLGLRKNAGRLCLRVWETRIESGRCRLKIRKQARSLETCRRSEKRSGSNHEGAPHSIFTCRKTTPPIQIQRNNLLKGVDGKFRQRKFADTRRKFIKIYIKYFQHVNMRYIFCATKIRCFSVALKL